AARGGVGRRGRVGSGAGDGGGAFVEAGAAGRIADGRDPRTIISGADGEGDVAGADPGGGAHHDVSRASDGGLLGVVDRHGEAARGGVGTRGGVGSGAGAGGGDLVGAETRGA